MQSFRHNLWYGYDGVYVPVSGTYTVWVRMQAASSSANSILLNVDSGSDCYNVGGDGSIPANSWDWVDDYDGTSSTTQNGSGGSNANPNLINVSLTQGTNTFELTGTESGVEVDRIIAVEANTNGSVSCTPTNTQVAIAGNNCAPIDNTGSSAPVASLSVGQSLGVGDYLKSSNGDYTAIMQSDGNFVVYSASSKALWNSGTYGNPGNSTAVMQNDGNFVIYGPSGSALWSRVTGKL